MILSEPKQSCERGKAGVFIPILQMKLAPPVIYWGSQNLNAACSLPKPVLFLHHFTKTVLCLKAIMLAFRFHAVRTVCRRPLSSKTTPLCCIHAGLTNSSEAVILLSKLLKIGKAIYFSNGKMSPQIRKSSYLTRQDSLTKVDVAADAVVNVPQINLTIPGNSLFTNHTL